MPRSALAKLDSSLGTTSVKSYPGEEGPSSKVATGGPSSEDGLLPLNHPSIHFARARNSQYAPYGTVFTSAICQIGASAFNSWKGLQRLRAGKDLAPRPYNPRAGHSSHRRTASQALSSHLRGRLDHLQASSPSTDRSCNRCVPSSYRDPRALLYQLQSVGFARPGRFHSL